MNIFFLDRDPRIAAKYLIDRHVVKMPIESATMLANIFLDDELQYAPLTQAGTVRKHGHVRHGCSVWVRESRSNYMWLLTHAKQICEEYTYRYGRAHFSESFIDWCAEKLTRRMFLHDRFTEPFLAMPATYKTSDSVQSYRKYYREAKGFDKNGRPMHVWTRREKPDWA